MLRIAITAIFCMLNLLMVAPTVAANNAPIKVVTSFSILQDIVQELGGKYVDVVNLVKRNSDAHMYQPKPTDAIALTKAELVIFNGLEFEGWMSRLIKNSDYHSNQLVASAGVHVISNKQEIDPHAWQSFTNIRIYIHNITVSLIALRPSYAEQLTQRKVDYLKKLVH